MQYAKLMQRVSAAVLAEPSAPPKAFGRRDFLKISGASGFALGLAPLSATAQNAATSAAPSSGMKATQMPAAFVAIARDGTVTVQSNRLDMGQGSETGLAMALAEELDADWSKVRAVPAPLGAAYVDPNFNMHLTGGSTAINHSYTQYRELGARTRAMLVAAAAAQWKVPTGEISVAKGVVGGPGGRKAGFGELADAAMKLPVPEKVVLKDPSKFTLIGRPVTRIATLAASRGQKTFGIDQKLPGMKTVVLAHAPVFGGRVSKFDAGKARAVKGVIDVFKVEGLDRGAHAVAVVAEGYWPAKLGRDALQVEWDLTGVEKVDTARQLATYRELAAKAGLKATRRVHAEQDAAFAGAAKKIVAEYTFPYLAHAPMEPLNCNIAFDGQSCKLSYGAQMHNVDAGTAAAVLGIPPEKVAIESLPSGGGFGRRAVPTADYVREAAQVAKAWHAAGRKEPLHIQWSREDDTRAGYYRPFTVHRAEIGLDAAGNVVAWKHRIVSQSIIAGTAFEPFMIKDGVDSTTVEGVADTPYAVPVALEVHHPKVNVPVLWWRSVGHTHTAYTMETLVDEVARASGKDPVDLRRAWLGDKHPRHRAALDLAVEKSGYGKRQLPPGRAFGVAVHESFATVVAYVVEASMENGAPVIHSVTAGVHCNLAVNPKSIETQIQGAALMGIGATLPGAQITLKDGVVEQGNFGEYTMARMPQMPKQFGVHIVPSKDAPTGIGEPGLPPIAPAIANAIGRLTGSTPRDFPWGQQPA
jgi:isoquinoline 1-oxidoreductase beta subunit